MPGDGLDARKFSELMQQVRQSQILFVTLAYATEF
jgi:hypothetical protein